MADRAAVLDVVSKFLSQAKKLPEGELTDDLGLYGDGLELDSLEAAELSALLEDAFGSDPFSADGDMPEKVGDITGFYGV